MNIGDEVTISTVGLKGVIKEIDCHIIKEKKYLHYQVENKNSEGKLMRLWYTQNELNKLTENTIFNVGQKVIVSQTGDRGVVAKVIKLDDGQNLYLINYKFEDRIIDRFCMGHEIDNE